KWVSMRTIRFKPAIQYPIILSISTQPPLELEAHLSILNVVFLQLTKCTSGATCKSINEPFSVL
ncbi:hypothetical protein, partial [uncultured Alteromonas sp.]|uniref:hypothetical protein n=1 Tax=uncultured Alteromonas sp. TaxID=179113 RepID=UPI0030D48A0D